MPKLLNFSFREGWYFFFNLSNTELKRSSKIFFFFFANGIARRFGFKDSFSYRTSISVHKISGVKHSFPSSISWTFHPKDILRSSWSFSLGKHIEVEWLDCTSIKIETHGTLVSEAIVLQREDASRKIYFFRYHTWKLKMSFRRRTQMSPF